MNALGWLSCIVIITVSVGAGMLVGNIAGKRGGKTRVLYGTSAVAGTLILLGLFWLKAYSDLGPAEELPPVVRKEIQIEETSLDASVVTPVPGTDYLEIPWYEIPSAIGLEFIDVEVLEGAVTEENRKLIARQVAEESLFPQYEGSELVDVVPASRVDKESLDSYSDWLEERFVQPGYRLVRYTFTVSGRNVQTLGLINEDGMLVFEPMGYFSPDSSLIRWTGTSEIVVFRNLLGQPVVSWEFKVTIESFDGITIADKETPHSTLEFFDPAPFYFAFPAGQINEDYFTVRRCSILGRCVSVDGLASSVTVRVVVFISPFEVSYKNGKVTFPEGILVLDDPRAGDHLVKLLADGTVLEPKPSE